MITDNFNLNRFLDAQSSQYSTALNEIRMGRKTSDWMWYIFPQYKGLGHSAISKKYEISCLDEAISYFNHPILGTRLIEISNHFLNINNKSANEILGNPDCLKMKSCMTLFHLIQHKSDVFYNVLSKYYSNEKCSHTISQVDLNKLNF
jgi:uncharacterized protein (DUF1810 family)